MKTVLIADDTKNIRLMLSKCMELIGWKVLCAENGSRALALLEQQRVDLIMLDIKMPELSGTEVLRRLRSAGDTTPVIVMTAYGTIKNAVETTNLGAVAYLQKPFTTDKLCRTLEQLEQDGVLRLEKESAAPSLEALLGQLPARPLDPALYRQLAQAAQVQGKEDDARCYEALARALEEQGR